jgi:hypothetical protein
MGMESKKQTTPYELWCMEQADGRKNPYYRMSGKLFCSIIIAVLVGIGYCLSVVLR